MARALRLSTTSALDCWQCANERSNWAEAVPLPPTPPAARRSRSAYLLAWQMLPPPHREPEHSKIHALFVQRWDSRRDKTGTGAHDSGTLHLLYWKQKTMNCPLVQGWLPDRMAQPERM